MKKKPIIGISTSVIVDQGGIFPGYERTYVNKDYIDAVIKNGGIPIMIPFSMNIDVLVEQVELLDGLILSGGHDVTPIHYGEEARGALGNVFPDRDIYDYKLLELAVKREIPILGICRGLQIINTYFGGTLYQDLSYIEKGVGILKHNQGHSPNLATHHITIDKQSLLYDLLGSRILVNSFHHQALNKVADDFTTIARSSDDVVEAIQHKNHEFLLGVQWHPEMLIEKSKSMNEIFKILIEKSGA